MIWPYIVTGIESVLLFVVLPVRLLWPSKHDDDGGEP